VSYAEPVGVNHGVLCWAEWLWFRMVILSQLLWVMVSYDEPVVVYHGVLCRVNGCESCALCLASGYESRWVKPSQWLLIMVCYAEQVVVSHGEFSEPVVVNNLYCLLSQLMWIIVCYAEQSRCQSLFIILSHESWCFMLSRWLRIMMGYAEPSGWES
jgi:hypothetical protein